MPAPAAPPESPPPRIAYEACPLCAHEDATDLGIADCTHHPLYKPGLPPTMRWLLCDGCGHVFVDGYFGPEKLELLFAGAHPNQTPGHEIANARVVSAKIVEDVSRLRAGLGGRWLDVGFGNGALLTTADEFGYDVVGLDLRRESVERMRACGYDAHCVDLASYEDPRPFDVISMADVLEHIPFPVQALERAHALLAPEGLLFVSMPNLDSFLWKTLDAEKKLPYWGEIEHLHNFGRKRIYALLRACGFEPCHYGISQRYIACMEVVARR